MAKKAVARKKTVAKKSVRESPLTRMEAARMLGDMITSNVTSLTRAGLSTHLIDGDDRNLDKECGYPTVISTANYNAMYEREGIARRVVGCVPEESWAVFPELVETDDPALTPFEEAWQELDEKFFLLHYLSRADVLSGIGRFGVLLLGLNDGKALSEPVAGINGRGEKEGDAHHELLYLKVFAESAVSVTSTESDRKNPRFSQPTLYTIKFSDGGLAGSTETGASVHWSRIIHIADGREMSEVYGTPRMKAVYNRLKDIRKILSGSGEMFWKGAFPGYSFEMSPDLVEGGVELDTESIREEFEKYANGLQRYLALTGVTAKSLSPQVADPGGHLDAQLKAIAISLSVPFRILFGSEMGKLASVQDSMTWAKRMTRRQNEYLTPMVVKPVASRLIIFGVLPTPEQFTVVWPDLVSLSAEDKAKVASAVTEAMAKYVAGGVDALIAPKSFLVEVMGFTTSQVDSIMSEQETYEPDEDEEEDIETVRGETESD